MNRDVGWLNEALLTPPTIPTPPTPPTIPPPPTPPLPLPHSLQTATWLRNDFEEAVKGQLAQDRHTHKKSVNSVESDVSRSGGTGVVPQRTFAASQEDADQLLGQISLPGSVNPEPKNEILTRDLSGSQSRLNPSRGQSGSMAKLGLQSSNVIAITIPEHDLESDSLSAIEKPQTTPDQAGKANTQKTSQQNPKMITGATSTSSIPRTAASSSKARDPLRVKRTRSNMDVSQAYTKTTPTKQPPHAKLKGNFSVPDIKNIPRGVKAHQRAATTSSVVTASNYPAGGHTRTTLRKNFSSSRLPQASKSDVDPKKPQGSGELPTSSDPGKGAGDGGKSSKSSQNPQAKG